MLSVQSIDLPTGVTLEYAEQGSPSSVPMVLLHAIADSRRIFEPLVARLPDSIRVFSLSQRGHGESSRPTRGYRPADFAADVAAFVDALGLDAAVIVGGSSGGVVARRFAIDHPRRVRGLVLLGSPFRLQDKLGIEAMWDSVFAKLVDPIDPNLVRGFALATVGESVTPRYR